MFEFDYSNRTQHAKEEALHAPAASQLQRERVARTMLLHWQEHCLECAPPQCYLTCSLYVARADRKCARLVYGFARNAQFSGLFDHGADLHFRRWGKIESTLRPHAVSVETHRRFSDADRAVTAVVNAASALLKPVSPFRRLNGALTLYRERVLNAITANPAGVDYDDFVMECFLAGDHPGRVLLEVWNGQELAFREAIALQPGANFVALPAARLLAKIDWPQAKLMLYPENDLELRLIFSWLDFVKYHPGAQMNTSLAGPPAAAASPAEKVKCVAWDLDDTLWDGVLIEQGAPGLTLRAEVAEMVRGLDERGILQTVVSKNDYDATWEVLKRFGLADYFLFPAINWGAKSANLLQVAEKLNIGIDTFALVDDSAFERAEVQTALPMVRVFSEREVGSLLTRPEFDVPLTEFSRVRRLSYLSEMQRSVAQQMFSGDYANFLRSCGMRLRIFAPRKSGEVKRCLELVQRSNQLNLSSRRFDTDGFAELLRTEGVLCVALDCTDKFGSYGIVGFVSVDEVSVPPRMTNLVMSCRVAQKRVEHAFFQWLAARERSRGCDRLAADLVVTSKNGPLMAVFDDLRFVRVREKGEQVTLELPLAAAPTAEGIVTVEVNL